MYWTLDCIWSSEDELFKFRCSNLSFGLWFMFDALCDGMMCWRFGGFKMDNQKKKFS